MSPRRRAFRVRACRALGLAVLGFAVSRGAAAADCLDPLGDAAAWSCKAELSTGALAEYCLQLTSVFGADPPSRFFKLNVTGPYPRTCTCGARGKAPGARYGESVGYLCLDRATDTVESGKITRKKITGETFNVSQNVRSKFSCKIDPSCVLPPILDPDLPPVEGTVSQIGVSYPLTAGGQVDLGYIPGCARFASEAPDYVIDHVGGELAYLTVLFIPDVDQDASVVVFPPSGPPRCDLGSYGSSQWPAVTFQEPTEAGLYKVHVGTVQLGQNVPGVLWLNP